MNFKGKTHPPGIRRRSLRIIMGTEGQGSGGAGSGGTPGRLIASQMNNGTKYRGEGLALAFYGTVGVRELLQFRM